MVVAHVGVGVFIVGATVTTAFSVERDFAVKTGERFEAAGFAFAFRGVHRERGPNYTADVGEFELRRDGRLVTLLRPERRVYDRQSSPMTEAAIDAGMRRDVFLALGDPLGNDSWAVRVRYKPLIRLIWLGALLMASGGLLAAADARYGRAKSAARSRREPGPDDVGAQSEPVGTSLSSSSNQFRT
jgi:cytochrome c-type biogenesis protein CcmF